MNITCAAFEKLNHLISDEPPEIGGILGSIDGNCITEIIIDQIHPTIRACSYEPNVEFLNMCINNWINNGICFKGIFHTHFAGVKTLSAADKKYIYIIMNSMPIAIRYLYFPIFVLPDRELICYKSTREGTNIHIDEEYVTII